MKQEQLYLSPNYRKWLTWLGDEFYNLSNYLFNIQWMGYQILILIIITIPITATTIDYN